MGKLALIICDFPIRSFRVILRITQHVRWQQNAGVCCWRAYCGLSYHF